ncbi:mitochondrial ATPase expression-domain-containing protein [Truncatella angustata]|uniref:Mitochondrial ATPase expression-domain-containing protein n=1 Tax=Truncatella angustata TaxID=152316 RepID=A0A9P8UH37_9PEZI|nr:mitochondrial ATPase expression-domain-containing protein [Truncatella angustata]KAH6652061.1 mitochondrial ATPase expression-domain-containing protein [Truncatella angustata]
MSGLNQVVEFAGPRMAAYKSSRGPPAWLLVTSPQRYRSSCRVGRHLGTRLTPILLATRPLSYFAGQSTPSHLAAYHRVRPYSTWTDFSSAEATFSAEDIHFLNRLAESSSGLSGASQNGDGYTPTHHEVFLERRKAERWNAEPPDTLNEPTVPTDNIHELFRKALGAMQRRDSRELLASLKKITVLPENELVDAVDAFPRTAFSEFLRFLDPFQIGRDNDPTRGVAIGAGMWQILSLGAVVDEWGTRILYTTLLRQMLILMRALHSNGQRLNINDYLPLFRAAGLTSDVSVTQLLWNQMVEHEISYWRNSITYDEFMKARFLTEPAYTGYDKSHLMMTPRNLHRQAGTYLIASVSRLDNLRKNIRRRKFKFGLNRNRNVAEDLSRLMRKRLPPTRLFFYMRIHGLRMTHNSLCQFIVAFARSGSLRFIQYHILEDYFGISVHKDNRDGEISVKRAFIKTKSTKNPFRPARPPYLPTAKLIDAVVYAYCSNGQLPMAFHIVDFISNKYRIPISPNVWFELLEWAYIMSTPPTSTAWDIAGLSNRIPSRNSVEIIWNTMTAPPYKVQPGFKQYDIFIRALLRLERREEAFVHMREARKIYEYQCTEFETAAFEYASAKSAGINDTKELQAFRRARFLKAYMRQRMNGWCNIFLEKVFRTKDMHDPVATRGIPDFVREWRDVLSNPLRYRIASGFVHLLDPAEVVEKTIFVRDHTVDLAMKRGGRWRVTPMAQKQFRRVSMHALGDLMSTRVDPLDILQGVVPAGRPSQSKRVDKWRAWENAQVAEQQEETAPEGDIWDDEEY